MYNYFVMNTIKCTFIRESFETTTKERDRKVYQGALISIDKVENKYKYAFKIEDGILRMEIFVRNQEILIEQTFADAKSKMNFSLTKKGGYTLTLSNGYQLDFATSTNYLNVVDFNIDLKYNLVDKNNNQVISFNEIHILREDVC